MSCHAFLKSASLGFLLGLAACTGAGKRPLATGKSSLTPDDCEARAQEFGNWALGLNDGATGEPSSEIDKSLAEIDSLPNQSDWTVAFAQLFEVTLAACPQILAPVEAASCAAVEDKLGILRDGLLDSLRDCGCKLGLAEAKALYFRMWREFQGWTRLRNSSTSRYLNR